MSLKSLLIVSSKHFNQGIEELTLSFIFEENFERGWPVVLCPFWVTATEAQTQNLMTYCAGQNIRLWVSILSSDSFWPVFSYSDQHTFMPKVTQNKKKSNMGK